MTTSILYQKLCHNPKPFIIAEIGVNYYDIAARNHISPLEAARAMIIEAVDAGADAVKFQSYKAENLAVVNSPSYWDIREEPTPTQYDLFKKYDHFTARDYTILADVCRQAGCLFLSTPFDFEAADYLEHLCPFFKISSSDLTNWPLIAHIAAKGKPVFLSTGASSITEIHESVKVITDQGNHEICLLHCVLSYPTHYEDAHLNMITHLRQEFPKYLIGYSDHTLPDPSMTCMRYAYRLGARVLEKHFTLDKTLSGNDHYHAMDVEDLRQLKANLDSPAVREDPAIISKAGGMGQKICLPCEEAAKKNARRSIVAKQPIAAGELITLNNITFKRPGTGLAPKEINKVLGHRVRFSLDRDQAILLDTIEA